LFFTFVSVDFFLFSHRLSVVGVIVVGCKTKQK